MKTFQSILQFQKHFNTEEKCRTYLEHQRWGNSPACPFCGSTNVCRFESNKKVLKCREKECRRKFTVTVGTVYENTKIPLTKWFLATYILTNHSKGISSHQLAKWLDITQKSAWFLNHRIREMLTEKSPKLLEGIVEVDESYVGGKIKNKPLSERKEARSKPNYNKTIVFGAVERDGKVKTQIILDTRFATLTNAVFKAVKEGSIVMSDEQTAYRCLVGNYYHASINHQKEQYVDGPIHTNTIEGYWSLLKRQINGIHHYVSPKHLQRYCNESGYRYNRRATTQDEKFTFTLANCDGRLKYAQLIKNI